MKKVIVVLVPVTSANNGLVMNIGGLVVGRTCEVQCTTNLASGVWMVETNFTATATSASITNEMSGTGQKFYRVNGC